MMKIRGIRKAFGKQHVLNGVDVDVDDGEVVVILGSSGSGKTTFVRCLNFLEKADAGHIDLDDSHICLLYTSPSPRDRQKSRMPSSA